MAIKVIYREDSFTHHFVKLLDQLVDENGYEIKEFADKQLGISYSAYRKRKLKKHHNVDSMMFFLSYFNYSVSIAFVKNSEIEDNWNSLDKIETFPMRDNSQVRYALNKYLVEQLAGVDNVEKNGIGYKTHIAKVLGIKSTYVSVVLNNNRITFTQVNRMLQIVDSSLVIEIKYDPSLI